MRQYHDLVNNILEYGVKKTDRTGTGTTSLFAAHLGFNLKDGFPLLTTKKTHFKSIATELLWFLKGKTDVKWLQDRGCSIWDEWATEEKCAKFNRPVGELGPVYGHQWRNSGASPVIMPDDTDEDTLYVRENDGVGPWSWLSTYQYSNNGTDQIQAAFELIKNNPDSRRIIVNGWNPNEATKVELPPCHTMFQFYVADGELSVHLFARSIDTALGLPFNIASYALLIHLFAYYTGLQPGCLAISITDAHIYDNHHEGLDLMLSREEFPLPTISIVDTEEGTLDELFYRLLNSEYEPEITVLNYQCHPAIKMEVAV